MVIHFDTDNLKKRLKTEFLCDGEILYWTVYDFAFKYRTRIFNDRNEEVAYVEKDIFSDDKANMFDHKGNKIDEMTKTPQGYRTGRYQYSGNIDKGEAEGLFENEEGKLTVFDENNVLAAIMSVAGMIEIARKD